MCPLFLGCVTWSGRVPPRAVSGPAEGRDQKQHRVKPVGRCPGIPAAPGYPAASRDSQHPGGSPAVPGGGPAPPQTPQPHHSDLRKKDSKTPLGSPCGKASPSGASGLPGARVLVRGSRMGFPAVSVFCRERFPREWVIPMATKTRLSPTAPRVPLTPGRARSARVGFSCTREVPTFRFIPARAAVPRNTRGSGRARDGTEAEPDARWWQSCGSRDRDGEQQQHPRGLHLPPLPFTWEGTQWGWGCVWGKGLG